MTMRLPTPIIPALVVLALAAGLALRPALTRPTTRTVFAEGSGTQRAFIVDGLRCAGTARLLTSIYEKTPGILAIETFASERRVIFTFDTNAITTERIRALMEAPVPFADGTTNTWFKCRAIE